MAPITLSRARHRFLADCLADRALPLARSARFAIFDIDPERPGGRPDGLDPDDIVLIHDFAPAEIDNNIGRHVAEELLPLLADRAHRGGWAASEQALFERFVGEIVRSIDGDERRAWHLFYDNTLAALARVGNGFGLGTNGGPPAPKDFIGDFAAIYRRVAGLIEEAAPATVLDVATCFGFLPLLLARGVDGRAPAPARRIVGCDLNGALVDLAADYAAARGVEGVRFVRADLLAEAGRRELDGPSDVVTAIHLLEHLAPEETGPALDALWALTGRRLVIAVPVEIVPDPRFGHRQTFDRERLAALGARTGGACRSFEDHGAWLVIDRPPGARANGACAP